MVEKELKFRMLGGVGRMVRFVPTGDCGPIPRQLRPQLWTLKVRLRSPLKCPFLNDWQATLRIRAPMHSRMQQLSQKRGTTTLWELVQPKYRPNLVRTKPGFDGAGSNDS